jgi:hypothetical protein
MVEYSGFVWPGKPLMLGQIKSLLAGLPGASARSKVDRSPAPAPNAASHAGVSKPELVLLSRFRNPAPLRTSGVNGAWEAVLKRDPREVLEGFVKQGLLVEAPPEHALVRLSNADLKSHLKSLGQPVSGNKADLVSRLLASHPNVAAVVQGEPLWMCSDTLAPIISAFLLAEDEARREAVTTARAALDAGDFSTAAAVAEAFAARGIFASLHQDMFPSLRASDVRQQLDRFASVRTARPLFFRDVPGPLYDSALENCMWECLQLEKPERHGPELDYIGLNLRTWCVSRNTLERYRADEANGLRVKVAILSECAISAKYAGKTYSLTRVPEIPFPGCRRLPCCACCYTPGV